DIADELDVAPRRVRRRRDAAACGQVAVERNRAAVPIGDVILRAAGGDVGADRDGGTGQQDVAAERRAAVARGIQRGVERDRAAAGRRLARIVGRELDVPAIGGDRAVDYDAVAGEGRDANALGRDIDRIGEGDVLRRLEDHVAGRGVDG